MELNVDQMTDPREGQYCCRGLSRGSKATFDTVCRERENQWDMEMFSCAGTVAVCDQCCFVVNW